MTVSVWQELAEPPEHADHDVAVVGAGIAGSYVARMLVDAGKDVALVDAREVAAGASGRNAGMVLTGMRHYYNDALAMLSPTTAKEIWQLTVENRQRLVRDCQNFNVEYETTPFDFLAHDDAGIRDLAASALALQRDGFDADFRELNPAQRGARAALVMPAEVMVQPAQLTKRVALASGATIYEHSEVYDLQSDPTGITVHSRRVTIRCGAVVLAINAYGPQFDPFLESLIFTTRAQALVTGPIAPLAESPAIVTRPPDGPFWYRQLRDGRMLFGGGRGGHLADEFTTADHTSPSVQGTLEGFIKEFFPEAGSTVTSRWAGLLGFTADFVPVVGSMPGDPRICFLGGFSGHGICIAIIAAQRTVELLLNGTDAGVLSTDRLMSS